jgi:predicted phage tail protein
MDNYEGNKLEQLPEISGAGGGRSSSPPQVTQNVTVVAPTRQPVEEANNLFSVAFAKTVYALSEGEVEGFPNGIEKDVFLDSTPIQNADGTYNFSGYTLDSRTGTDETQTPMAGFSTVETAVGVNIAVTQASGPITRSITDTDIERCRVIIGHPALQSTNQSNGDITGTSVSYRIAVSTNGGPYVTVAEPTVSGKSSSDFQRAYEFDLSGSGPWSIRVTRLTADSSSAYLQNGIVWQSYTEIIDEKFAYPNTAALALKVDARQFNSIPDVSVRLRGKRVQIPTNYNPVTRVYTGIWDGTFTTAWTDNPAWIFRDIVLNARFGVARYMPSIAIDPWYLYTVAQYADQQVPDGAGGTEPRFTCNVYLQNPGSVYEVLNALASCFRGLIYYSQGKLFLTQDRAQLPVQQFSEANVIQEVDDSGQVTSPCFTYSGTAKTARKSVVLANWDDPNQVYSSVTEYLQDDVLLEKFGYNPIDLRLLGVTSRGQALRAAKHTLFSNRYETEKVSFRIGAEGLAASVGEIIQIADPLKQGQRLGGRVRAVDTENNRITLDAVLNLNPAISYTLTLVIPDGQTTTNPDGSITTSPKLQVLNVVDYSSLAGASEQRTVTAQNDDYLITQSGNNLIGYIVQDDAAYTVVRLNGVIDTQPGAIWVLEWTNLNAALYKVISISEVDPLIYQVEAIQYNNSKFGYVDNDLPIAVPKDRFTLRAPTVPTNVTAQLVFRNNRSQIDLSWVTPQVDGANDLQVRGYRYQWRSVSATEWSTVYETGSTSASVSLPDHIFGNTYQVRVSTVSRLGQQSDWVVATVAAFTAIPDLSDPTYNAVVRHQNQPDGTQLLIVDAGTCPIPERVTGYRVWAYPTNVPTVVPGVKEPEADGWYFLSNIPLTGYYTIAFHAPGEWEIRVAFTSAIFGETPSNYIYDTVERSEIVPPSPSLFTVVQNTNNQSKRFSWQLPLSTYGSWDQGVVSDVVSYQVRFKQGGLIDGDAAATWEKGIDLFSGGVPATQQWFETSLFDSDEWTVMIKAVDATKWSSDIPAYILVNIGNVPLSNAVYNECLNTTTWPGAYINAAISDTYNFITQAGDYLTAQNNNLLIGDTGVNILQQINPLLDSYYTWNFDNNFYESSILITTGAVATYQHNIGALTGADTIIFQENGNDVWQENDDQIFAEQRTYTAGVLSGESSGVLHPYAPYEQLIEDVYQVQTLFRSPDGITAGGITSICFDLDYADVIESQNDVVISSSGAGTAIPLLKTFRVVKSVQLTLQSTGSGAINAIVVSKSVSSVTVKCVNSSGTAVSGLIDMTVVGY